MTDARPRLVLATGNQGKAREFESLLGDLFFVLMPHDLGLELPDVEETGSTFAENSKLKAQALSLLTSEWTLADDSGLEVDALNGAPGVFSARYAGWPRSDERNNLKLLEELKGVPPLQRTARFRCTLCLAKNGTPRLQVDGVCEGFIATSPRGSRGFGYDPLFIPVGYEQTFAELGDKVKDAMSHRGRAVQRLKIGWSQWRDSMTA